MRNINKIVIFDWGGVVESHYDGEYNCFSSKIDIINRLNSEIKILDEKAIIDEWEECNYDKNGKCISEVNNKEDIQNWFERIKRKFNLNCSYDAFYKVYQEESEKIEYYKDVVNFAHSLKDKCLIGILSNLSSLDKSRIDKHYDLSKFDYVWLSFDMNCRKPNGEIYEKVEDECKIDPKNILFIDDVKENIVPAQKRGWITCNAEGHEIDKIKKCVEEFLL